MTDRKIEHRSQSAGEALDPAGTGEGDSELKRRLRDVLPEYCTQLLDDVSVKLDKLARITAMAETGTAENFLACDDETKRLYFAQGVEDSAALKATRSELRAQASALAEARRSALEEAAKVCDHIAIHAERRAATHENEAAKTAALDKMVAARACAVSIRERALTEPQHGNG